MNLDRLSFHGAADFVVPMAGFGAPWFDPPVPDVMQTWAEHDGCAPERIEERVSDGVLRYSWANCDARAALGGRPTSRAFSKSLLATPVVPVAGAQLPRSTMPPSTEMIWPVMLQASSLHRKVVSFAMSSGVCSRPRGVWLLTISRKTS